MNILRTPPLSEQVRLGLRKKILNGEFKRGERIPSEEKLADQLGVSRTTIRSALTGLANEGIVIRRQGDGTFINHRAIGVPHRLETHWQFSEFIQASGMVPRIEVIEETIRKPSDHEAAMLEISLDLEVLVVRRLFLANGLPAILTTDVLPCASLSSVYSPEALSKPILEFLESYCGKSQVYNIAEVSVCLADKFVAEYMNVDQGEAIICLEEVFYDVDDQPIMYAHNHHDGQVLKIKLVRGKTTQFL